MGKKIDVRDLKKRWSRFTLVLYPDADQTHRYALDYIKGNFDYAAIVHDSDIYSENDKAVLEGRAKVGDLKPPHCHVVVKKAQQTIPAFANLLGIKDNYIQGVVSKTAFDRYLLHCDEGDKFLYSLDDLFGNLVPEVRAAVNLEDDECYIVIDLIDLVDEFIDSHDRYIRLNEINKLISANGYWSVARRGGSLLSSGFVESLKLHNSRFIKSNDEVSK